MRIIMYGKNLVLLGGGGHCKSVLDAVLQTNEYDEIVITDLDLTRGTEIYGCRVVGNDDILPLLKKQGREYAFITVGSISDTTIRRKPDRKIRDSGFKVPVIADPSAVISDYSKIGAGTFIGKNAAVNADAVVGENGIINTAIYPPYSWSQYWEVA